MATTRQLVFADHLPYPGPGFIKASEAGYTLATKSILYDLTDLILKAKP